MFPATWFWRAHAPRRFLISNGLATMGFAVPAAVAAARVTGSRSRSPATAGWPTGRSSSRPPCGSAPACWSWSIDDASLSLIRIKHEAKGHDRSSLDFGPVAFDGASPPGSASRAVVADDEASLRARSATALGVGGPALIDARLSGAEYARTLEVVRG